MTVCNAMAGDLLSLVPSRAVERLGKEGNVEGRGQNGLLLGEDPGKWEQSLAMLCLECRHLLGFLLCSECFRSLASTKTLRPIGKRRLENRTPDSHYQAGNARDKSGSREAVRR